MRGRQSSELVLALYPCARGLAFVLFEGPLSPLDWAVKDIHGRQVVFDAAKALIERHQPEVIVLQGYQRTAGRRARPSRIERMIATYAAAQAIECHRYTRDKIHACFRESGAITRYETAQAIVAHIPALNHRLPPVKKLWKSEDARMALFDAAALAMTYFCNVDHWKTGFASEAQ